MKKAIILILVLLCYRHLIAGEKTYIDNLNIQEYKGKPGKWILVTSKNSVLYAAKEYAVSLDEIYSLNDISKINKIGINIFVPYSESYMAILSSKGVTRTEIENSDDEFIWPIEEARKISSVLGLRGGKFHSGLDIPAEHGVPVCASMGGRVIWSGYLAGFGNAIEVEHRSNFITRYAHNSSNLVKKGDFVKKGQIIALAGSTGNSTGNHVHFEIRCIDVPLDPLDFLPINGKLKMPHTIKNWK